MDLSDYRFTESHEWVQVREGLAYVGITDHAQEQITDITAVELPAEGKTVKAGDEIALVDSVKSTFSIFAPVGGKIVRVNESVVEDPSIVNTSPYGEGWLVAIEMSDPSEIDALMDESEYEELIAEEE
ncbi:MAG: glycine cleavage system protein GcvH [Armatimonadota bacterium]|jgi:glycine cleavage system H protein